MPADKKWELLTYERARLMLGKRKFRRMTDVCRLYPGEGQSFVLKLTSWRKWYYDATRHRWVRTDKKVVFEPPIAIIHPDNVVVLDDTAGEYIGQTSCFNLMTKFFGIAVRSRSDKRSSVRWWWIPRGAYSWKDEKPFVRGMQYDMINQTAVTELPKEQRRRVVPERAKPVREAIATWDKYARTYFTILEWTPRHYALLRGVLKKPKAIFPDLTDEPSEAGLFQILVSARHHSWWRFNPNWQEPSDTLRAELQALWPTAFYAWKEHLYEKHNVFHWVDTAAT